MTSKLFRAVDVCELAQLQPYVLRSWEKEFPDIGVQKGPDSPRLYRQSDVDQVLRIKELVFGEGLTLAGARRKLERVAAPRPSVDERQDVAEVLDALASDARTRILHVRDGLRSILRVLSAAPGTVVLVDVEREVAGTSRPPATVRTLTPKGRAVESRPTTSSAARKSAEQKVMAKARPVKAVRPSATAKVVAKGNAKKRSRASA